jgi:hypothetical protein
MNQEKGFCNQQIKNIQVAASSFLNYETYATGSFISTVYPEYGDLDNEGKKDDLLPVTLKDFKAGKIYKIESDGSLTSDATASAASSSGCTVTNAVREVFYTIYYEPVGGLYSIKEVQYDLIIED